METSGEDAGSALNIVLVAGGEVPEEGIDVFITSDIVLTDYFGGLEEDYSVPYGGISTVNPLVVVGNFWMLFTTKLVRLLALGSG